MIQYGRQWIRPNAVGGSRSEVTFWPARGDLMGVGWGGRGYPFLRGVVWIPRDVVSASVGTLAQ